MMREWLIDGYNVCHVFQKRQSEKGQKRLDRLQYLHELAQFAAAEKTHLLVVLDGKGQAAELDSHDSPYFHAVYSQELSADSYIEKFLFDHKGQKEYIVVTDDRAVANIALGSGARVIKSGSFLEMLFSQNKNVQDLKWKLKTDSHGFNRPFEGKI